MHFCQRTNISTDVKQNKHFHELFWFLHDFKTNKVNNRTTQNVCGFASLTEEHSEMTAYIRNPKQFQTRPTQKCLNPSRIPKKSFLNMTNIHGCVEGCRSGAETFLQTNLNDLKTHAVSFRPVSQSSRSRHIFAEKGQRGAEESGIRPRRSALELCVNSQKKNKQKKKRRE